MELASPAFEHHQTIPARYTCEGDDISVPLEFKHVPAGVKSFAIIVDDPDAPHGTFDHWIAWNIPGNASGLREGEKAPKEGLNGFGVNGYRGPCPPAGGRHRYFFKVYALDTTLDIHQGATKAVLEKAMQGHILSKAELIGTYQRSN